MMCKDIGDRLLTAPYALEEIAHMSTWLPTLVQPDDLLIESLCFDRIFIDCLDGLAGDSAAIDEDTTFLAFKQDAAAAALKNNRIATLKTHRAVEVGRHVVVVLPLVKLANSANLHGARVLTPKGPHSVVLKTVDWYR